MHILLADPNNTVFWSVSNLRHIPNSSNVDPNILTNVLLLTRLQLFRSTLFLATGKKSPHFSVCFCFLSFLFYWYAKWNTSLLLFLHLLPEVIRIPPHPVFLILNIQRHPTQCNWRNYFGGVVGCIYNRIKNK